MVWKVKTKEPVIEPAELDVDLDSPDIESERNELNEKIRMLEQKEKEIRSKIQERKEPDKKEQEKREFSKDEIIDVIYGNLNRTAQLVEILRRM